VPPLLIVLSGWVLARDIEALSKGARLHFSGARSSKAAGHHWPERRGALRPCGSSLPV